MLVAAARGRPHLLAGSRRCRRRGCSASFRRFERRGGNPQLDAVAVHHHDIEPLRARALCARRNAESSAEQRVAGIEDGHFFIEGVP